MNADRSIVVAGAGSIGCFVGGMLAASGRRVALLARQRMMDEIDVNGLRLTNFDGFDRRLAATEIDCLRRCRDFRPSRHGAGARSRAPTRTRWRDIIAQAPAGCGHRQPAERRCVTWRMLSKSDCRPAPRARAAWCRSTWWQTDDAHVHRSTSGDIVIERDDATAAERLSVPGLELSASDDIDGVQWGKLMVNLNQRAQCAVGVAAAPTTGAACWRKLMADQMAEGLSVIKAERHPTGDRRTPISSGWRMPPGCCACRTSCSRRSWAATMHIDPEARSSMWEDLHARAPPPPKIDYLQGVITGIADRRGLEVPAVAPRIRDADPQGRSRWKRLAGNERRTRSVGDSGRSLP